MKEKDINSGKVDISKDYNYLRGIAYRLMQLLYCGVSLETILEKDFVLYRDRTPEGNFQIYHYTKLGEEFIGFIEIAVLHGIPKPHSHEAMEASNNVINMDADVAFFCFLDNNGAITMGGLHSDGSGTALLTKVNARRGQFTAVVPGMFHAGQPWDPSKPTVLFIINSNGLRERPEGENYTLDTVKARGEINFKPVKFY
jgi:hypothetical protein